MSFTPIKEFVQSFKEPFNREVAALKKAKKNLRSRQEPISKKEGNLEREVEAVKQEWDNRRVWGEVAHKLVQDELLKNENFIFEGWKEKTSDEYEIIPLEIGKTYIEKTVIDPLNMLWGYADKVEVDKKGYIHITDFKTFKELRRDYTGKQENGMFYIKNFFSPIEGIVDCNFNEAALQASLYMYILWTTNKRLKIGKIFIEHLKLDEDTGQLIGRELHEAPFLLAEVKKMLRK